MKRFTKSNLAAVQAYQIQGDFFHDEPTIMQASAIALDLKNTLADRLEALHQIDRIMGIRCPYPTETELASFVTFSGGSL